MTGRGVLLVLAVLAVSVPLAAGAAAPTVHQAALSDFPTFLFAPIAQGQLRGDVAAIQKSAAPRVSVFVSLHGVPPSSAFKVTVTDLPCSRNATPADAIVDLGVVARTRADEDDFFARENGRANERLARGKSFRIYAGDSQLTCATVNRVR